VETKEINHIQNIEKDRIESHQENDDNAITAPKGTLALVFCSGL